MDDILLQFKESLKFLLAGLFGAIIRLVFEHKVGNRYSLINIFLYFFTVFGFVILTYLFVKHLSINSDYKMIISICSGWAGNTIIHYLYKNEGDLFKQIADRLIKK